MNVLQRLRERFWFIPAVLCVGALAAASGLITLDERVQRRSLPGWVDFLVYRVGVDGSREVLGAIATSSLAVAGTMFSITIAVLALTSSSYGPRLIRNFMADRGNQIVLGVYVSTFLYSLLVLRSIRSTEDDAVFVPHLSVNVAGLLAVLNVAVLVYFVHHISDSIQIATLAGNVRSDLCRTVDVLYPARLGKDERAAGRGTADARRRPAEEVLADLREPGAHIRASQAGFVQFVREEALMDVARKHGVLVLLRVHPGRYVLDQDSLAVVHPRSRADDDLADDLRATIRIADARTPHQDIEFAIQQLTEMAVRALSPGTNDPYTAMNALQDLTVGLARLAGRDVPSPARYDDDGELRVHAPRPEPADVVSTVIDNMRWYASSAPSVMHATLELVERVGDESRTVQMRAVLREQVHLLREAFAAAGHQQHDVRVFDERCDEVLVVLSTTPPSRGPLEKEAR